MATVENLPSPSTERPIGFGRLKRKEDARFIRGQGTYLDDIKLPGMVYGALLRSPYAHFCFFTGSQHAYRRRDILVRPRRIYARRDPDVCDDGRGDRLLAGRQGLHEALDRWLYRLPGGLVISNLGACAIFAALTGSSPACCAAIGKMGIPEMRRRGYPDDVATGSICAGGTLGILIPPSITFILYGIATETSIGRLFLAGVMPGLMLTSLFMLWTVFIIWKRGFRSHAIDFRYSWKEKFQSIPKIAPFLAIIFGVMYSLYGGVATPSEAAGVGAALCPYWRF